MNTLGMPEDIGIVLLISNFWFLQSPPTKLGFSTAWLVCTSKCARRGELGFSVPAVARRRYDCKCCRVHIRDDGQCEATSRWRPPSHHAAQLAPSSAMCPSQKKNDWRRRKGEDVQRGIDEENSRAESVEILSGIRDSVWGKDLFVNSWRPDLKWFQCVSGWRKDNQGKIKPWNNFIMHTPCFPCTKRGWALQVPHTDRVRPSEIQ